MSDLLTPADIERLARELGIPMAEVCRRAGIATSIFQRWKGGLTSPSYRNYQRIIDVVTGKSTAPAANDTPKTKAKRPARAPTTETPPSSAKAA